MQITRTQIRKMILKEMAEIIPFPMQTGREETGPPDDGGPISGILADIEKIRAKVDEMKATRSATPNVSRRMVHMDFDRSGAPVRQPGRGEQLAKEVVEMTAHLLDDHYKSVLYLSDSDPDAKRLLPLFEDLDMLWVRVAEDRLATRLVALEIGRRISSF